MIAFLASLGFVFVVFFGIAGIAIIGFLLAWAVHCAVNS